MSARVRPKKENQKNEKNLKKKTHPKIGLGNGMNKQWNNIKKVIKKGAKIHQKTILKSMSKFDAKKGSAGVGGIRAAAPQEHLQINKITCSLHKKKKAPYL